MATIRWEGLDGYVDRRRVFVLAETAGGWRVYMGGNPLDQVNYGSVKDACTAVDAALPGLKLPEPAPPRREPRRFVPNRWTEWVPHPGTERKPPR